MALFLALLLCSAPESAHAKWIETLVEKDDETARNLLLRKGTPALGELESARKGSDDLAAKNRLTALIEEIRRREPHGVAFFVGLPKMRLTPRTPVTFTITARNKGSETVVLHPYLSIRLLDADGKEVKRSRKLGRHGRRAEGHPLEAVEFVTLKPGEKWSVPEDLSRYMHDPDWITGWKTPAPGTYTLEFTYAYDRKGAEGLDEQHPAHAALSMKHTFTQELRIDP